MEDKVRGTSVEKPTGVGRGETQRKRKKVLLSFVGMRDPYNDNNKSKPCTAPTSPRAREDWGSILTICEHIQRTSSICFPPARGTT